MENLSIWCWFIPAVVGIVCALFGYLIGKSKNSPIDRTSELNTLKDKNAILETDLAACKKQLSQKAALGKTVKRDDLKIVEGIGPKIQQLFHSYNIKTWKDLSETAVAKCQEILDSGGAPYKIHDPASWPMQAKMAYEGKWKDLYKWQEEHKRGKL